MHHAVLHLTRPLLLASLLAAGGCVSTSQISNPLERLLATQQPAQALSVLEKEKRNERDQALYHLNKAVLLRMNGQLHDSNAELEAAKKISEKLDAISLREQAAAVSVNDAMRSYLPPPFEGAMLYSLKILNYLELNDLDGARVEALQLDVYLKQKFEQQEPPFARYLMGLAFEAKAELSDALIAYRKAYEAYKAANSAVPRQLQADLLRLTDYLELADEHNKLADEFKLETWPKQAELKQQGELIVVVFSGLVPHKQETSIMAQSPRDGQLHRISIPFYEQRRAQVDNFSLHGAAQQQAGESFTRIDQQAAANLKQQMPGIITRTVARVAVKNKVSDNLAEQSPLLGIITNLAGVITEQADTRGWNTLPQQILLGRLALPPGEHDIQIKLKNYTQTEVGNKRLQQVSLQATQKQFVSWHWPVSTVISRNPDHANTQFSTTIQYRSN